VILSVIMCVSIAVRFEVVTRAFRRILTQCVFHNTLSTQRCFVLLLLARRHVASEGHSGNCKLPYLVSSLNKFICQIFVVFISD